MNRDTILTVAKSLIIILILLAVVFALRAPAADLNILPNEIKGDYVDSSGLPYFSEMDSYYNLRLTEDYVDHGFVGDENLDDGTQKDLHRYAPDGNIINYELGIVYVTSFFNDMVNQFIGGHTVREVAFWTGAVVASLAVIPAFIFARRLTNDYGAIAATLIIVLAPNYFAHTFPGFFDTDMFYYIFSLFFIFFFVESIRTDNIILKIVYAFLSMVSIGLFSISWTGYIFYVGLMGIFAVVYLIACYIFNVGEDNQNEYSNKIVWFLHQKEILSILILVVLGAVCIAVFRGVDTVFGMFNSLLSLLSLQSTARVVGGFPNVLISVAEMQMPNMLGAGMGSAFLANSNGVVNGIGGIFVMFAGLIVLYILVRRVFRLRKITAPKTQLKGKPSKADRVSASKKIDDQRRFKLSLGELGSFGDTQDEISKTKRLTVLYASLFLVWTLLTILAVTRGSRFITTIVLPFGLMTGVFIGYASDYIKHKLNNDNWLVAIIILCAALAAYPLTQISLVWGLLLLVLLLAVGLASVYLIKQSKSADNKSVPVKKYVAVLLIVLALVSPTVCGAYITANQVVPGTSDPMWNAMTWINENSENNTVITSWWDFGYLFEIAADRQVTFDGGSQSGDRAFWLGQAMTTSDLELSAGIFRMLDSTGTRAQEALYNYTQDYGKSTDILIDILPMSESNATNTLVNKYHLNAEQAAHVVNYTHPDNPRPVIFVASSDMLQKAGWWSYFGAWNFTDQSSENYNYYVPRSQLEVAPGETGRLNVLNQSGLIVNTVVQRGTGNNSTTGYTEALSAYNNSEIILNGSAYNPLNISNIMVIENGYLVKNESVGDVKDANYTLFLMGENNTYTPILIHNKLANSMFTQLYLLGGANQNVYEMVHMENGVSLWKIHFENTVAGGGTGSNSTNQTSK
ncbi:STT3 domain-containing protein [Methanobrevibacter millerae]|uniref:dolichyl-phosphooligosaccharide-protein glycotransferase n=1 Tax=Methanobrevibacter millerae TaxID=230361 RepID=A0A1G5W6D1_9EURY|nr:STT3 domain-containing protein [Methanobrevibacter millerae]SDA53658.1 dolichyl-diphosphooligosaccharide--protein glycosyltransferase [Methanobrevibacter millerae]